MLKQQGNFLNQMIWLKLEEKEMLKWYSQKNKREIKKLSETTVDKSAEIQREEQVMFLHAKLVKFWNNPNLNSC